ncbi:hypothetical protein P175DRAFT_0529920 [Aspergillus ochraceoroseus IBT 24754]|uniref:Uncharacterized protein n=1 Tax=Aspergillus ochraceoroseus IBT 24754 TaxID=1392256 RepID=A0A2T5M2R5_9EURO|nr:uncharacterized protein P175DRAFT_0529920 [Aspergillus ochraceoroseus IBT 24754]PTU22840.1 hypothetical protein P175DRAFT_0529920 [Aspergillus ochraceoroseus IBT 24754]
MAEVGGLPFSRFHGESPESLHTILVGQACVFGWRAKLCVRWWRTPPIPLALKILNTFGRTLTMAKEISRVVSNPERGRSLALATTSFNDNNNNNNNNLNPTCRFYEE